MTRHSRASGQAGEERLEAREEAAEALTLAFRLSSLESQVGGKREFEAQGWIVFDPEDGEDVVVLSTLPVTLRGRKGNPTLTPVLVHDLEAEVLNLGKWAHRGSAGKLRSSNTIKLDVETVLRTASGSEWMGLGKLESLKALETAMDAEGVENRATQERVTSRESVHPQVRDRVVDAARRVQGTRTHLATVHVDPEVTGDLLDLLAQGGV